VLTPAPAVRGIETLLGLADILIPNETEAALLAGETDAEAAACALSELAGTVVLTCGSRGAVVASGGRLRRRVAARPVEAKDTTGAGDAFAGVLVTWLAEGQDLDAALDAATAAASLSVGREGAASSMPTRAEIDAVLNAR
jgi:ribokinase